jgi:hypothetical protein
MSEPLICIKCTRIAPEPVCTHCKKCGMTICIPCLLIHDAQDHPMKVDPAQVVPVV